MKGFDKEEIVKFLNIASDKIDNLFSDIKLSEDIHENSLDFYSELQKDLSKLVLTEMNKPNRESVTVLNAIKLQSELQEKKLALIMSK